MISKYLHYLNLPQLTKVGTRWNFRCVICGDSKKSSTKKRGWILNQGGRYHYYCHNCGASMPFYIFLKEHYPQVYKDYIKDYILSKNGNQSSDVHEKIKEIKIVAEELSLEKLSDLDIKHKAVQLFIKRKIPKKWLNYLYYTDNYMEYVHSLFPDKCETFPKYDRRIVIPYYSKHKKITCIQGRSINKYSNLRYITIKFDDNAKKVCGIERINSKKPIFVTEGFFDSCFLPNAISMGGADLNLEYLTTLAPKDKFIFVFDLEFRNIEICNRIEKVIAEGFKVCLLPHSLQSFGKDINEMVIKGIPKQLLFDNIKNNTFQGLSAKIQFKLWKQC